MFQARKGTVGLRDQQVLMELLVCMAIGDRLVLRVRQEQKDVKVKLPHECPLYPPLYPNPVYTFSLCSPQLIAVV